MTRDEAIVYAIKTLVQPSCEDAISRQAVKDILDGRGGKAILTFAEFKELLDELPPVTPKPKTGHWKAKTFHELFCDNCGFDFDIMRNDFLEQMKYCPNCGEKKESEVKE